MTAAIVWLVLWFLIAFGTPGLIWFAFTLGGGALAAALDKKWPVVVGWLLGALSALTIFIIGLVNFISQIVAVVELVNV